MDILVHHVQDPAGLERIQHFRYRLFAQQGLQNMPDMDHIHLRHDDQLDDQSWVIEAWDRDSGQTLATMRTTPLAAANLSGELEEKCALPLLLEFMDQRHLSFSTPVLIDPRYRSSSLALTLGKELYQLVQAAGIELDLSLAPLATAGGLLALGYRPYRHPVRLDGQAGLHLPLCLPVRDRTFLTRINSPFRHLCNAPYEPLEERLQETFTFWQPYPFADSHLTKIKQMNLFPGMDKSDLKTCLKYFLVCQFYPGDMLIARDETEDFSFVMLEGILDLKTSHQAGAQPYASLSAGEGRFIAEHTGLAASGISAVFKTASKLMFIAPLLLEKTKQKQPALALQLMEGLHRLTLRQHFKYEQHLMEHSRHLDRVLNNEFIAPDMPGDEEEGLTEEKIPKKGLELLLRRHSLGQTIEINRLLKLGFEDHRTILNLHAGLGLTTQMLARHFPHSQVIGVEPDPFLRRKAEKLLMTEEAGASCQWLDGSADNIPLPNSSVDFVYAHFLFQRGGTPFEVLQEIKRVTKSGGKVVIMDVDIQDMLIYPEPKGFKDFLARIARAQDFMYEKPFMGHKLLDYMTQLHFREPMLDILPLSSVLVAMDALAEVLIDVNVRLLKEKKLWLPSDKNILKAIADLPKQPKGWLFIPLLLVSGQPQKVDSRDEKNL